MKALAKLPVLMAVNDATFTLEITTHEKKILLRREEGIRRRKEAGLPVNRLSCYDYLTCQPVIRL
jgi:hypothetical protein